MSATIALMTSLLLTLPGDMPLRTPGFMAVKRDLPLLLLDRLQHEARAITVRVLSTSPLGSGIVIQREGSVYTVVTNQHVLRGAKPPYRVQMPDGQIYVAEVVVGIDLSGYDLALLQFRSPDVVYAVARLGSAASLSVADEVFAAGFPAGYPGNPPNPPLLRGGLDENYPLLRGGLDENSSLPVGNPGNPPNPPLLRGGLDNSTKTPHPTPHTPHPTPHTPHPTPHTQHPTPHTPHPTPHTPGFAFRPGRVTLVLDRPLEDGYQVGSNNDVEKGMSGGPLLNRRGEVVGINGIHAYPLWDATEYYADGSEPCAALQDFIARSSWGIPIEVLSDKLSGTVSRSFPLLLEDLPFRAIDDSQSDRTPYLIWEMHLAAEAAKNCEM